MSNSFEDGPPERKPDNPDAHDPIANFTEFEQGHEYARINTEAFQAGDVLFMKSSSPHGNHESAFAISSAQWTNLQIFEKSELVLAGRLSGPTVPAFAANNLMTYTGSGLGGAMISLSGPTTATRPYYFAPGVGHYTGDTIDDMQVLRKDRHGFLAVINPNQMLAERSRAIPEHKQRLQRMYIIADQLGLGNRDMKSYARKELTYEDTIARYDSSHIAAEAMYAVNGKLERLSVLNKSTKQWYGFKYDNQNGNDFMKVATATVNQKQLDSMMAEQKLGYVQTYNGISRCRADITTFVTSQVHGINSRVFLTSPSKTVSLFDVPVEYLNKEITLLEAPTIPIIIDEIGRLSFDAHNSGYRRLIREQPRAFSNFERHLSSKPQTLNDATRHLAESDIHPEPTDINKMLAPRRSRLRPGWLRRTI